MNRARVVDAWANLNKYDAAISNLKKSAELQPDDPRSQLNLARTLAHINRHAEAIVYYRKVLKLTPKDPRLLNELALLLATHPDPKIRNGKEAVKLSRRACRLTNNRIPATLETLAAAYAEVGNFPKAIETMEKALKLAQKSKNPKLIAKLTMQIEQYRQNQSLRLPQKIPPSP
ncbi:tetratricopeptide repeat protein [Myxococcota bacterium]